MTENRYGTTPGPARATLEEESGPEGNDDPSMKGKASETASAGKQAANDVAQHAAGQAKEVAAETKRQARDLVGEARGQLADQAGVQHRNLVTNLRSLADELSGLAGNGQGGGTATELVAQAGGRAHVVADWLDRREPGDLVGELRSYAQRRPGAFLAGAVVAGILAGRLTRGAAAAHSYDSDSDSDSDSSADSSADTSIDVGDGSGPRHGATPTATYGGSVAP